LVLFSLHSGHVLRSIKVNCLSVGRNFGPLEPSEIYNTERSLKLTLVFRVFASRAVIEKRNKLV